MMFGERGWTHGLILVLLMVSPGIACKASLSAQSPGAQSPSTPVPKESPPRRSIMLRRQPGGMLIGRATMNFWNVDVAEDGSAVLVAEGTPLIRDGRYSGVLSSELWALIGAGVTEIKSTPATIWTCMHASDFQVYVYYQDLFRNACISEVDSSGLAG